MFCFVLKLSQYVPALSLVDPPKIFPVSNITHSPCLELGLVLM